MNDFEFKEAIEKTIGVPLSHDPIASADRYTATLVTECGDLIVSHALGSRNIYLRFASPLPSLPDGVNPQTLEWNIGTKDDGSDQVEINLKTLGRRLGLAGYVPPAAPKMGKAEFRDALQAAIGLPPSEVHGDLGCSWNLSTPRGALRVTWATPELQLTYLYLQFTKPTGPLPEGVGANGVWNIVAHLMEYPKDEMYEAMLKEFQRRLGLAGYVPPPEIKTFSTACQSFANDPDLLGTAVFIPESVLPVSIKTPLDEFHQELSEEHKKWEGRKYGGTLEQDAAQREAGAPLAWSFEILEADKWILKVSVYEPQAHETIRNIQPIHRGTTVGINRQLEFYSEVQSLGFTESDLHRIQRWVDIEITHRARETKDPKLPEKTKAWHAGHIVELKALEARLKGVRPEQALTNDEKTTLATLVASQIVHLESYEPSNIDGHVRKEETTAFMKALLLKLQP